MKITRFDIGYLIGAGVATFMLKCQWHWVPVLIIGTFALLVGNWIAKRCDE